MQLPRSVQAGAEIIRFALAAELGENGRIVLFYLYPLQFARFSGMLIAALWD